LIVVNAVPSRSDYDAYWLEYLRHHRKFGTRVLHILGTSIGILGGIGGFVFSGLPLALTIAVIGYSIAIASHFLVEGNRPFAKRPLWGLYADFRMIKRTLTGSIGQDLERL
jgi:hypothetical protein